jgi:membrane associated rhomboid family serine protease
VERYSPRRDAIRRRCGLLPIKDSNPTSGTAWVTIGLIAANVAIFLLWQPTLRGGENADVDQQVFFFCHGFIPYEVTHRTALADGGAEAASAIEADLPGVSGPELQAFLGTQCPHKSWLASIFEAMFLHGGWLHIGGNMLFLWIFGNNIEDRLGGVRFILFYLVGGVAAAALQTLFSATSTIPNVGASGAIAAVLGAYIVLYPRARVMTAVFFFFITVIELPAMAVLGIWFVLQLFDGVGGLGSDVNGGVAYFAHVGGFVFGSAVAYLFLRDRGARRLHSPPLPPRPDWDPGDTWRPY